MTSPGTPPNSDAEWARDTENRLRQLEAPNTMRVGPWVISSRDGDLIATKPGDEIVFGQLPDTEETTVSDVTRGFVTDQIKKTEDKVSESIGNPNGGGGIPIIKDFLNGKWDDIVAVQETADARQTAGNNLVTNPGFEKPTPFYLGDGVITTAIKRTGTKSGQLTATGAARKLYLISNASGPSTVTATAGDIFYVEFWVWGKSTNSQVSGGANGIGVFLEVYNKDGSVIGQPLTMNGTTASNALNNQWTRVYGYIGIPASYTATAGVSAYLGLASNVTSGEVYYFDDPIVRVDSLVNAWNYVYDAANGTSGSTGKGPADVFMPLQNVRNTAITGASGASGALNTAVQAASGASGAKAYTQNLLDRVYIGFKNITGFDFGLDDAERAARDVNTSLSNLNIITSNLLAQQQAGMFYGTALNENLSTYTAGSTLGSKWSQWNYGTGSATWSITDTYFAQSWTDIGKLAAAMAPDTGAYQRLSQARLVATTATRYQRIGVVFLGIAGSTARSHIGNTYWGTYIYGRMSADGRRYVYVKFENDNVVIGFNNGGFASRPEQTEIPIENSRRTYRLKSGVTYWLECGLSATAQYTYRLWENNTAITTAVDSSASSPNSPTDSLGAGIGGYIFNNEDYAGAVAGFSLFDNVPPVYRGIGFKASNKVANDSQLANSNFNLAPSPSNNNTGFMPDNWYTLDYATNQMLYDASTNTLTVAQPGWYAVVINQRGTNEYQGVAGGRVAAAVFKDAGSGNWAVEALGPDTVASTNKSSFGGTMVIYLQGGDRIRPGYWSSWSTSGTDSYVGTALGAQTYWSVTFLHNSYIPITTT